MRGKALQWARILATVAGTTVALGAGTNYVYSAWAPQFSARLKLSATQSNLVGLAANLGMYTLGVPIGIFIDKRGPRFAVLAGAFFLGLGYFFLHTAYNDGTGSLPVFCLLSYLTGLGGCMSFMAAMKTAALNWPHHRGTATGLHLAAFGLSAFFFSTLGSTFFSGDTGAFLELLSWGTFSLTLTGLFFMRVVPRSHYDPLRSDPLPSPATTTAGYPALVRGRRSEGSNSQNDPPRSGAIEPGMSASPSEPTPQSNSIGAACRHDRAASRPGTGRAAAAAADDDQMMEDSKVGPDPDQAASSSLDQGPGYLQMERSMGRALDDEESLASEASSLLSEPPLPGAFVEQYIDVGHPPKIDVRGFRLLVVADFWLLWFIMGILSGIGLMTINNIGNNATALWKHYDPSVDETFLISSHQMHVSILSVLSFSGRLLSGLGSDFLTKVLHASRVWCLFAGGLVFALAQLVALQLADPRYLGYVSGLSGLAYGLVFGVLPSIVAETFGVHGMSQNWGMMILSPVVWGYVFNVFYGTIYDHHSIVGAGGERVCLDGLSCYRPAYVVTLGGCLVGLGLILWVIRRQRAQDLAEGAVKPRD